MPCYLFTYHGHGTWLPDHPRGYVHRTRGLQPRDVAMAEAYRRQQKSAAVAFTPEVQGLLIEAARAAAGHLVARLHGVAVESTHVHVLISWCDDRPWMRLRAAVRYGMTRCLNVHVERRKWFSDSPSRKRVKDMKHFEHLVTQYLPKHTRSWVEKTGAA